MIPHHYPADLMELLAPVAMATIAHREMSQLVWDKIFSFLTGDRVSVFSFVYYFPYHQLTSPYFLPRSLDAYVSAA